MGLYNVIPERSGSEDPESPAKMTRMSGVSCVAYETFVTFSIAHGNMSWVLHRRHIKFVGGNGSLRGPTKTRNLLLRSGRFRVFSSATLQKIPE